MGDVPVSWAGFRRTGGLFSGPIASSLAVRSVRSPPLRSCGQGWARARTVTGMIAGGRSSEWRRNKIASESAPPSVGFVTVGVRALPRDRRADHISPPDQAVAASAFLDHGGGPNLVRVFLGPGVVQDAGCSPPFPRWPVNTGGLG